MSMSRWDPLGEMISLREAMDRLFEESFTMGRSRPGGGTATAGSFPIDLYEQGDNIVIEADMPGVKPEDVEIQVQGDQLLIAAQTSRSTEQQGEQNYYRRERTMRRYARVVALPAPVESGQAEAAFENGCLRVTLPKSEQARTRRIPVRGAGRTLEGESRETGSGQSGQNQGAGQAKNEGSGRQGEQKKS